MPPSNTIYISGLPYDFTEEQINDIAKSVGPIKSCRLLFDLSTGKSKGISIIEYFDTETGSSAVRNLNRYSVGTFGGRERLLRCNFIGMGEKNDMRIIDDYLKSTSGSGSGNNVGGGYNSQVNNNFMESRILNEIPPLPPGVNLQYTDINSLNASVYASVTQLDQLGRLRKLVEDAKIMSKERPDVMKVLLKRNPQLSYALVQAATLLNYLSPEKLKELFVDQDLVSKGTENITEMQVDNADVPGDVSSMDEPQRQIVRMICGMREDEITMKVGDANLQKLYLEIKRKYTGYV
ncbi:unnamed protein product [Ambrosiozyma monospora]|uniref:Unnamed protein product n=1 Tax=Ambrosiozyma monospora TaxID=43982 RepID=A0A9W6YZQ0_AMBMO|nr:unnamed protein product [Ambrosiozyma monospora]